MPPYFFRYSQEAIRAFYLAFIEQAAVKAPVFLYNIPFFTTPLDAAVACELLATGRFAGIKDSSGDLNYFEQLTAQRKRTPFTLMIGNDVIFTRGRSAGAHGVVSGVACGVPELMVGLDRAITGGDTSRVERLQKRLEEFISWIDSFPTPVGVKEAVSARGLQGGPPAAPLGKDGERKLGEFREWFKGWLPAVQEEARAR
jgi:4-hydroxy-tetrahydrodipicolinate synthase